MYQNPNPSSTPDPTSNPNPNPSGSGEGDQSRRHRKKLAQVHDLARRLAASDAAGRVEAAREVRRLARSSAKARSAFAVAAVVEPLVAMLPSHDPDARESALLALLNLAVRNERNKDTVVKSGALPHLVELLRSETSSLRELATAAALTLSASPSNQLTIATSGAVPYLVKILISGSIQGKVDAVTTLYNLSTCRDSSSLTLPVDAAEPLLTLLKDCKKYSKFAEKATSLLEILSKTEEGRNSISDLDGGILTLVETVEDGSLLSTECAVGVLLSLCCSSPQKYKELILKEGAIPGLLLLTVEGTEEAQKRARKLLDLLRDQPSRRASEDLRIAAYDIAARVDGPRKAASTAKRLLHDMIKRNMELTMARMEHRAAPYTPKTLVK
ncbi:U-box domain-containing protein 17-like [Typha angustifolia]|uniref:U-box domain-containing protein 17-like n=1 Tax=Typha angustifolia TaxID=59011 RepID=UPI003C2C5356